MTVFAVEHECDDVFYSPYLVAIFSTYKKAEDFIHSKDENEQKLLEIYEVEVDKVE